LLVYWKRIPPRVALLGYDTNTTWLLYYKHKSSLVSVYGKGDFYRDVKRELTRDQ
jgi:hypothetical protein